MLAEIRALREEMALLRTSSGAGGRIEKRVSDVGDASDDLVHPSEESEQSEADDDSTSAEEKHGQEAEEMEPRLSRAPPPLDPCMLEELTLGRVGAFVGEDLRTQLYAKKWKVPASLLIEAKDQPAPRDQHWNLPGKEALPVQLADAFNKADGVVTHSRPALSFGSETVAAQLRESPLLSK